MTLDPHVFVLFGGTGDLSKRLVLPALLDLSKANPDLDFVVLATARAELNDAQYRDEVVRGMVEVGGITKREAERFAKKRLYFQTLDNDPTPDDYERIRDKADGLAKKHGIGGNRVYYLALPPGAFEMTAGWLGHTGMNAEQNGWVRIVVEKPFGHDLASARHLNAVLHRYFDEHQIYRIDHYLAKETVQNLLVFRMANPIFERLWNRDTIERVDILVAETVDVGTRGGYYDHAGATRDMIQNHLTQLFTLVAMEIPAATDADAIRAEKVKVLRSTLPVGRRDAVFGQYTAGTVDGREVIGYRQAPKVRPDSDTPTFASFRLHVENWRWQGVPFVLTTGKALRERVSEIVVTFRTPPVAFFRDVEGASVAPNQLRFELQPDEAFTLSFGVKRPGDGFVVVPQHFSFDYNQAFGEPAPAYRTLVEDIIRGDQTLFVHADEVEASWTLYDPVLRRSRTVYPYPAGSGGPQEATKLTPLVGAADAP
ncbi:MAG: glucose-6-phosphate dehydrogenase [Rhodothermales bacterium]|nr:glucose-6-phosphate dehydrogenase [Rhodothermales bacterium]MCA0268955.1 glucose-6-phosphate dehydrogenase [Bacteroidota bacterium]